MLLRSYSVPGIDVSPSIEQASNHINVPFGCSQAQGRLLGLDNASVIDYPRVSQNARCRQSFGANATHLVREVDVRAPLDQAFDNTHVPSLDRAHQCSLPSLGRRSV